MGARWYDPDLGRFIQPDTIVPQAGNPQSFNRYSYVNNRPVNLVDPTGHEAECQSWDTTCWEDRWFNAQGLFRNSKGEYTRQGALEFKDAEILGETQFGVELWGQFSEEQKGEITGVLNKLGEFVGGLDQLTKLLRGGVSNGVSVFQRPFEKIFDPNVLICNNCVPGAGTGWLDRMGIINLTDSVWETRPGGYPGLLASDTPFWSSFVIGHEIAHVLVDGVRKISNIDLALLWNQPGVLHEGSIFNEQIASAISMAVTVPVAQRGQRYSNDVDRWVREVAQPLLQNAVDLHGVFD